MIRCFVYIVFLLNISVAIGQIFDLKRNSFSAFAGNVLLDCKTRTTHQSYSSSYNDGKEDFKVQNQSSVVNPKFGAGYCRKICDRKDTNRLRSSQLLLTSDLSYSRIDYRRSKAGTFSGGIAQYFFDGTVREQLINQFLTLGFGAKYYFISATGHILGIAVGIERNTMIANYYSAEYYNKLDGRTWINSFGSVSLSGLKWPASLRVRRKNNDVHQDYFAGSIILSAGEMLSKKCHAGLFVGLTLPEYLFYTYKTSYERTLTFTANTNYLNYFNIINYGIYCMF